MVGDDYYAILGVPCGASAAEIKHAFRIKAKNLHPDISNSPNDSDKMKRLIRAYKTLIHPDRRAEFDAWFFSAGIKFSAQKKNGFDYRQWLLAREDAESRVRLILFDLFNNNEDAAVAEYQKQRFNSADFSLERVLGREDFMDYGFILAEALSRRGEYYDAYLILSRIMRLEYEKPYFLHFFPEVQSFTRAIIRTKLRGSICDELALDCWEDALELNLGEKDDAVIYRLMAEAFMRIGDEEEAFRFARRALELDSKVQGKTSLKRILKGAFV